MRKIALDKCIYSGIYLLQGEIGMETAKVFNNGGSQAVRLPKNCRFDEGEVMTNKIGNMVILIPKEGSWDEMRQGIEMFSDDFLTSGVPDLPLQERANL